MIAANASAILLVTGVLTAGIFVGVVAPKKMLDILLGVNDADATMVLTGRYLSLLVGLVGALLVYASYHPEVRVPAMVVAIVEKLGLGLFVVTSPLRTRALTLFIVGADAVMALLLLAILFSS